MEAGKWSWREPGRSEMRRESMCYRNGKRCRDKACVKDTGNEKELQYFQPLVPGVHKDIAWPWQMELHMLAVKPHQTRLYVPTCGLRITKSRQFGRNRVSMCKVSEGFMGFRSMTGRTTRSRLMYWTVAYIGPSATLYSFGEALWDVSTGIVSSRVVFNLPHPQRYGNLLTMNPSPALSPSMKNNQVHCCQALQTTQCYAARLRL